MMPRASWTPNWTLILVLGTKSLAQVRMTAFSEITELTPFPVVWMGVMDAWTICHDQHQQSQKRLHRWTKSLHLFYATRSLTLRRKGEPWGEFSAFELDHESTTDQEIVFKFHPSGSYLQGFVPASRISKVCGSYSVNCDKTGSPAVHSRCGSTNLIECCSL